MTERPESWDGSSESAAAAGMILRAGFNFSQLDSADWTGLSTIGLTPTSGTVEDEITFTLMNMGNATSFGPNGTTGIDHQSDGTTEWWSTADPSCPAMSGDVADLIGSTPNEGTIIVVVSEWSGDLPGENYKHHGHAVGQGNDSLHQLVQRDTTIRHTTKRNSPSSAEGVKPVASPTWMMSKVGMGGIVPYYGTGDLPTTCPAGTQDRVANIAANAPNVDGWRIDMATAWVRTYTGNRWGGTLYTPVLENLNIYEIVA